MCHGVKLVVGVDRGVSVHVAMHFKTFYFGGASCPGKSTVCACVIMSGMECGVWCRPVVALDVQVLVTSVTTACTKGTMPHAVQHVPSDVSSLPGMQPCFHSLLSPCTATPTKVTLTATVSQPR